MNKAQRLAEILAEIKRRQAILPSFVDANFPLQSRLVTQDHRFQGWKATRRAAKSNTFARRMLRRLTQKPCKGLYMALTLDSAKGILFDVIQDLLDKEKVPHHANRQAGTFSLENGSFIKFAGIDSSFKEMRKILGQAYAIVGLDECGSMTQDMDMLVNGMITPALTDELGDLILLGTAEAIPNTYFQKVMDGKVPGWHLEEWTTYQNPYMAKNWDAEIKRILETNPLAAEASWFRSHYMNIWVTDDALRIYKLSDYNLIPSLTYKKRPRHIIGVDLGFDDDCAFVVGTYFQGDPTLYIEKSFKSPGLDITDTANAVKRLLGEFPNAQLIVDGANKQGVEEMKKRHKLGFRTADKTDKFTFMRILKDDFIQNRVQIVEPNNTKLVEELNSLMRLKDAEEEDPRCQNHLCDALLYLFREARNYIEQPEASAWISPDQKMKENELKEAKEMQDRVAEMNWGLF